MTDQEEKKYSINEIIKNPELLNSDGCWSFYDWFCTENSLERRAKGLFSKVKFLVDQGVIDGDKNYVWFKNSQPCSGTSYDDFRISTLEESHYLYGCCPYSGYKVSEGECSFWTLAKGLDDDELIFTNWLEFKNKVKKDSEFQNLLIAKTTESQTFPRT